jgi:hypothetical protein
MKHASIFTTAIALLALAALHATPAQAQAARVFVSGAGNDNNNCSITLPCHSFQKAHDSVAANGVINVLDPGNYGPVTITKSISIDGHGWAGVTSAGSGNGITINAGATDNINLSGIVIDGLNAGANGIAFNSGGYLQIADCTIRHFVTNGVLLQSNSVTGGTPTMILNSVITQNNAGINVIHSILSVDRSTLAKNGTAFVINDGELQLGRSSVFANTAVAPTDFTGASFVSFGDNHFFSNGGTVPIFFKPPLE